MEDHIERREISMKWLPSSSYGQYWRISWKRSILGIYYFVTQHPTIYCIKMRKMEKKQGELGQGTDVPSDNLTLLEPYESEEMLRYSLYINIIF